MPTSTNARISVNLVVLLGQVQSILSSHTLHIDRNIFEDNDVIVEFEMEQNSSYNSLAGLPEKKNTLSQKIENGDSETTDDVMYAATKPVLQKDLWKAMALLESHHSEVRHSPRKFSRQPHKKSTKQKLAAIDKVLHDKSIDQSDQNNTVIYDVLPQQNAKGAEISQEKNKYSKRKTKRPKKESDSEEEHDEESNKSNDISVENNEKTSTLLNHETLSTTAEANVAEEFEFNKDKMNALIDLLKEGMVVISKKPYDTEKPVKWIKIKLPVEVFKKISNQLPIDKHLK